jgi:excisionase family DNA binding protein
LNAAQVGSWIGVSTDTVLDWVQTDRIPFVRIPGSRAVRFDRDEIAAWLRNGRPRPSEPVSAPPVVVPGATLVDEQTTWFYGASFEGLTG